MKMKRMLALCLSVLLLCGTAVFAGASGETAEAFAPVFRFVASSDTHVSDSSDVTAQRIGKMMRTAYTVAENDKSYQKLDAVLVVGDLTDDGTKTEFEKFSEAMKPALRAETALLTVVAKNHDGYALSRGEIRNKCKALSGFDADFHVVLGGFHFIGLSASESALQHYDLGQLTWLKKQLDEAVKADPNKPVFVMHHEPTVETVYGSGIYDGWGVPYFGAILSKYPQVVEICGHSHYPVNDPRSVWQGDYTAINTGAVAYTEFTIDAYRAYHPADRNEVANYWIIELDAQNNLRLRGMDLNAAEVLCDLFMKNPANKANRAFSKKAQREASVAPAFNDSAALSLTTTFGGCKVLVPAAETATGEPVTLYRVKVKDKLGGTVQKDWLLPQYYRADGTDEIVFDIAHLSKGTYTLEVRAETCYGKQSAPLTATVTVDGLTGLAHVRDLFVKLFEDIKDFFVHLFW